MKKMKQSGVKFAMTIAVLIIIAVRGTSQTVIPEVLTKSTLQEQMNYIQDRTRIYENYRAIREDMFQKIKDNALDSLSASKREIKDLYTFTFKLNNTIDSLNTSLEATKNKLNEITITKNSIRLLGLEVNKLTYNIIMWTLVTGLIFLLTVGFLAFIRNRIITKHSKKEYEELKNEFEAYRQTSREAREKMSASYFNELRKLRDR